MPTLRQCLPVACWDQDGLLPLLDVEVVAIKLNDASACGRDGDLFATWPGSEKNIRRWFELASGKSVAIVEEPERAPRCSVMDLPRAATRRP
jgi:hypothetical protein